MAFGGNFSWRNQRVFPSEQESSISPARVANHSARFTSSCPLADGASNIIMIITKKAISEKDIAAYFHDMDLNSFVKTTALLERYQIHSRSCIFRL